MEERINFASNGIKAQVAMFIECEASDRDAVDALVMSLPLATALGVTKVKVWREHPNDTFDTVVYIEMPPEVFAVEQMFNKASEILEQGVAVFFEGAHVHFLCAETTQASVNEIPAALEGLSLPGRRAIIIDGEETH